MTMTRLIGLPAWAALLLLAVAAVAAVEFVYVLRGFLQKRFR